MFKATMSRLVLSFSLIPMHDSVKKSFYNYLDGKFEIKEFEKWVYGSKILEESIDKEDYLELISLNYNNELSSDLIKKIIFKSINISDYETRKMISLLSKILEKGDDLLFLLAEINSLYSEGYKFLKEIRIDYNNFSDALENDARYYNYNNSKKVEDKIVFEEYIPESLEKNVNELIELLNSRTIQIIVVNNPDNDEIKYSYTDNRF